MDNTTITLNPNFVIDEVSPLIFGGFIEHIGRCVYEGIYAPGSAHADANGFRKDVLDALAGLQMTIMRYPGGNFASGYHWLDGVGPAPSGQVEINAGRLAATLPAAAFVRLRIKCEV